MACRALKKSDGWPAVHLLCILLVLQLCLPLLKCTVLVHHKQLLRQISSVKYQMCKNLETRIIFLSAQNSYKRDGCNSMDVATKAKSGNMSRREGADRLPSRHGLPTQALFF